jgi:predicted nucleic acid-binding protein
VIVVDARVLIAHFNADDSHHSQAEAMLLQTAGHPLAASSITLAEVLVGPARAGKLDVARAALGTLEVEEVPVRVGAAVRLAAAGGHKVVGQQGAIRGVDREDALPHGDRR